MNGATREPKSILRLILTYFGWVFSSLNCALIFSREYTKEAPFPLLMISTLYLIFKLHNKMTSQPSILAERRDRKNPALYYWDNNNPFVEVIIRMIDKQGKVQFCPFSHIIERKSNKWNWKEAKNQAIHKTAFTSFMCTHLNTSFQYLSIPCNLGSPLPEIRCLRSLDRSLIAEELKQ